MQIWSRRVGLVGGENIIKSILKKRRKCHSSCRILLQGGLAVVLPMIITGFLGRSFNFSKRSNFLNVSARFFSSFAKMFPPNCTPTSRAPRVDCARPIKLSATTASQSALEISSGLVTASRRPSIFRIKGGSGFARS